MRFFFMERQLYKQNNTKRFKNRKILSLFKESCRRNHRPTRFGRRIVKMFAVNDHTGRTAAVEIHGIRTPEPLHDGRQFGECGPSARFDASVADEEHDTAVGSGQQTMQEAIDENLEELQGIYEANNQ